MKIKAIKIKKAWDLFILTRFRKKKIEMENLVQLSGLKVVIVSVNPSSVELFVRQIYQLSLKIEIKIMGSLSSVFDELHSREVHILIIDLQARDNVSKNLLLRCKRLYPELRIMVFCDHVEVSVIKKLFTTGIHGYLTKNIQEYELDIAMKKAMAGESYVSIEISGRLANHFLLNKSR